MPVQSRSARAAFLFSSCVLLPLLFVRGEIPVHPRRSSSSSSSSSSGCFSVPVPLVAVGARPCSWRRALVGAAWSRRASVLGGLAHASRVSFRPRVA